MSHSTAHTALGFIGAGNMAEAIARGVLRAGLYPPEQIFAADPSEERRRLFTQEMAIRCTPNSPEVAAASEILILAVKPQMTEAAMAQIAPQLKPGALVISIIAAISTGYFEKILGAGKTDPVRVIRVLPNTPMLVGAGMSVLTKGAHATDADMAIAERIFGAGGKTMRVPQEQMNIITGFPGSGPAYFFYLTEALAAAGVKQGISEADAAMLARETIIGAAALLKESKDSPAELRRKVTSPGGTTQAAIATMEKADFFGIVAGALQAATQRAKELSK